MPRNNVSVVRQGKGGYTKPRAVETFYQKCPHCLNRTEHGLYHSVLNGRPSSYKQCSECGAKHTSRFLDTETDKQANSIKSRNEQIWGWLRNNLENIMTYDPFPKFMLLKGTIGNPRRHKGKKIASIDFHPEFLKYLETPEAIKFAKNMFDVLMNEDERLYIFIYLRASGYTYKQIDETGLIPGTTFFKARKGKSIATDASVAYNRRALNYITLSMGSYKKTLAKLKS